VIDELPALPYQHLYRATIGDGNALVISLSPKLSLVTSPSNTAISVWPLATCYLRLLDLGARHADVGQTGNESLVILADPEGNEFCVLAARRP
jgi:Glyoxalase-like domain